MTSKLRISALASLHKVPVICFHPLTTRSIKQQPASCTLLDLHLAEDDLGHDAICWAEV